MAAEAYFDEERENSAEHRVESFAGDEADEVRNLPSDPLDWEYI